MRIVEFRLEGAGDLVLPLRTLAEIGKNVEEALKIQTSASEVHLGLSYFGPGGSKILRLSTLDVPDEDALDVVVRSFQGTSGGRMQRLRPIAALNVRKALKNLMAFSPEVSVRVNSDDRAPVWARVSQPTLDELDSLSRRSLPTPPLMQQFVVVGTLCEINADRQRCRVKPANGIVYYFSYEPQLFPKIDDARWGKVRAVGIPALDAKLYFNLAKITDAESDDPEGFMVDGASSERDSLLRSLDRLASDPALRKPGWDGYTSAPLLEAVIAKVRVWLTLAHANSVLYGRELPLPFVVPTRNGGVQLEWKKGTGLFELEFEPNGSVMSFLSTNREEIESEKSFNAAWDALQDFLES